MFDHCDRLSNASLFQRGHGLVTTMLAIVTKVLPAYFSKEGCHDNLHLQEAQQSLYHHLAQHHLNQGGDLPHQEGEGHRLKQEQRREGGTDCKRRS